MQKKTFKTLILSLVTILGIVIGGFFLFRTPPFTLLKVVEIVRNFAQQQDLSITSETLNINPDADFLKKIQALAPNAIGNISLIIDGGIEVHAVEFPKTKDAKDFINNHSGYFIQKDSIFIQVMAKEWRQAIALWFKINENDGQEAIAMLDNNGMNFKVVVPGSPAENQLLTRRTGIKIVDTHSMLTENDILVRMFIYAKCSLTEAKEKMRNPAVYTIVTNGFALSTEDPDTSAKIESILTDHDISYLVSSK